MKTPYSFTVQLTDWGWKVYGRHQTLGDLYLIEQDEYTPPMSDELFSSLWDLIDENIYKTKHAANLVVRDWLRKVSEA
jgi:hypothetical protein